MPLKKLFIREDRQRRGAGFLITTGDGERIKVLGDGAGGGRRALDLGNHAQAGGIVAEGISERAEVVAQRGGGAQFFHARQEFFDLGALVGDDFVQLVHRARKMGRKVPGARCKAHLRKVLRLAGQPVGI